MFTFDQIKNKYESEKNKGDVFSVVLSPNLRQQIKKNAEKEHMSESAFVRTCLRIGILQWKNERENNVII